MGVVEVLDEDMQGTVEALWTQIEDLSTQINLLMRVVGTGKWMGLRLQRG